MDASTDSSAQASPVTTLTSWLSVISVAFGTFVMVTTEFLPIGLLSRIAKDLGVTEGAAGLMVTTPGVVAAIAAPAAAFGMRSIDRRWMLLALTALVLVSNLVAAGSQSFSVMLVARFLLGISVGSFWAFAGAVGRRLVEERHGATATAIVLAGISIGTVLGLPLGSVIGNLAGWRVAFEVGAVLSVVALAAEWWLLPALKPLPASQGPVLGPMLKHPLLLAGFAFAFLVILGHFAAYTYLEPYLTQQVQMNAAWLGVALYAYGVAGFAGNFVGAHMADRHVQRTFKRVAALLALSIVCLAATHELGIALLSVVGWGAAFGAVPACIQIWLYRAGPDLFESSSALMVTVFQIALAAGSWVGGMTTDGMGLHSTMLAGACLAAVGVLAMLAYRTSMPNEPAGSHLQIEL